MRRSVAGLIAALMIGAAPLVHAGAPAAIPRPEYPRPEFERPRWMNLNGPWQFRFDPEDQGLKADWGPLGSRSGAGGSQPAFKRTIVVPFPWESQLSGVHQPHYTGVAWYARSFTVPADWKGLRVWLRFEAVDYQAKVWVNGRSIGQHEGGYTPFAWDITPVAPPGSTARVVVRAWDPTDPQLPTGKQIHWYTHTSGIWQTVWLEARPAAAISNVQITPSIAPAQARFDVDIRSAGPGDYILSIESADPTVHPVTRTVRLPGNRPAGGEPRPNKPRSRSIPGLAPAIRVLAPTLRVLGPMPGRAKTRATQRAPAKASAPATQRLTLTVAVDRPRLWTPAAPQLYDVVLKLRAPDGQVDTVKTYFGLRTITRGTFGGSKYEYVLLNGKPIYLRGALDQSFNPWGIYTAPSDAFLKHDIELAKSFGFNFLRIHIKIDEPRRIYWADRLGLMLMCDMPNTWQYSARARVAWEATLRQAIARDRNHPAIFAWVDFNETWGLGPAHDLKTDPARQRWVEAMYHLTRALDPTRLAEDISPCNYDHVATALNSWHFYIDDYAQAARHVRKVVRSTYPGSPFNFVPGHAQGHQPLINSEYGAVSAGGGDRDVSWGFRTLTTLLRQYAKIQGYVYTELADVEWEHNGFVNYDRSAKQFGYDAFVPGMTPADLQRPDFIGFDGPPVIETQPGRTIEVPVFVSHYSDHAGPPRLRWRLTGIDALGCPFAASPAQRPVRWRADDVTQQDPLSIRLPDRPLVGAVGLELIDAGGKRLAANFVNVVSRPAGPLPRVEVRDRQTAVVRFRPADFERGQWTKPAAQSWMDRDKVYGYGSGFFEYTLRLPAEIVAAEPDRIELVAELAAKADTELLDWPSRRNPLDYPQTQSRQWPTSLRVLIDGQPIGTTVLPDDPADARGVLSHLAHWQHGSYGYITRMTVDLARRPEVRQKLASSGELVIRFEVPADAPHRGGLAIFGERLGRAPLDPTIIVHTARTLGLPAGWMSRAPVAVNSVLGRRETLVPTAEQGGALWSYTTTRPGPSWSAPGFDAGHWRIERSGFGTPGTPGAIIATRWDTPDIWLRTTFTLADGRPAAAVLRFYHDEDIDVLLNGRPILHRGGYADHYLDQPLDRDALALLQPGKNLLAVHCHQTFGGQGVDLGLWAISQRTDQPTAAAPSHRGARHQ